MLLPGLALAEAEPFIEDCTLEGFWISGRSQAEHLVDHADLPCQDGANNLAKFGTASHNGVVPIGTWNPGTGMTSVILNGTTDYFLADGTDDIGDDFDSPGHTFLLWINYQANQWLCSMGRHDAVNGWAFCRLEVLGIRYLYSFLNLAKREQTTLSMPNLVWIFTGQSHGRPAGSNLVKMYSTYSTTANTLLDCQAGCATYAVDSNTGSGSKLSIGSTFPPFTSKLNGLVFQVIFFSVEKTEEQVCSICRCGLLDDADAAARDAAGICNACTMPAGRYSLCSSETPRPMSVTSTPGEPDFSPVYISGAEREELHAALH
jgi:hypothetical protein